MVICWKEVRNYRRWNRGVSACEAAKHVLSDRIQRPVSEMVARELPDGNVMVRPKRPAKWE